MRFLNIYPVLKKAASPYSLVREESTKVAARFYNHKGFVLRTFVFRIYQEKYILHTNADRPPSCGIGLVIRKKTVRKVTSE